MSKPLKIGLFLSLSLAACAAKVELSPAGLPRDPQRQTRTRQSATETVRIHYLGVKQEGLRIQAVDSGALKFVQATLVGQGIASPLVSGMIPVGGAMPTLGFSQVPRASGQLRVITVQGFDAGQQPLSAFRAAGFYRSEGETVQLEVNRRQLLTGLALEALLASAPAALAGLDLTALQSAVEAATGFDAGTKTFVSDPTLFAPSALAGLLSGGQVPTPAELITAARLTPPVPSLQLNSPLGGDFAEALSIRIDDPLSSAMTLPAGTVCPYQLNTQAIPPGDWMLTISRANGSVVGTAQVSVSASGGLTLSQTSLTLDVPETPVITGLNLSQVAQGSLLTLSGRGFSPILADNKIYLGSQQVIPSAGSTTSLTLTVPGLNLGQQPVTVTIGNQTSVSQPLTLNLSVTGVSTLAGDGTSGYVDGPVASARFESPSSVALDSGGNLYVAANSVIRKITPEGMVSTLAGDGNFGYVDGPAASAEFQIPRGLLALASGDLLLVDGGANVVRKVAPDGTVSTLAGSAKTGLVNGPAATARFNGIYDLALDTSGNLLITDFNNAVIRQMSPAGMVSTYAGTGSHGKTDGSLTTASFNHPAGLAFDSQGNLFVVDQGNHNIRKITPAGEVTTFAGSATGSSGYLDGAGTAALFNAPEGICIDKTDTLLVADVLNNRIRKITPDGQVSTLAGEGTSGFVDGPPLLSKFTFPYDLTISDNGILYIADYINNSIRLTSR